MDESKQININSSSIIDLKAELFRKQEVFRLKKLSQTQNQLINEKNNDLYSNQLNINYNNSDNKYKLGKRIRDKAVKSETKLKNNNSVVDYEAKQKLIKEKAEEEKALKKSRNMLEIKSKLYEKLSNNPELCINNDDEEIDDRILVDFERKAVEKVIKDRNNLNDNNFDENIYYKTDEESEEWTEFVDSLGRSRKCLKTDLKHLQEVDREMFQTKQPINANSKPEFNNDISVTNQLSRSNELLSNDLKRELDRREWESNASMEVNSGRDEANDGSDTHYQNVEFNEIRDHGVAYYSFSKDSQQREEQMNVLNSLRQQTESQKIVKQKLKDKRKNLMRERLAKIAQRKGISIDLTQSSDSDDDVIPQPEPEDKPIRSKPLTTREWDLGKEDLLSELPKAKHLNEDYIQQMRVDRNPDFAPPVSYSNNESKYEFRKNFREKSFHYKPKSPQFKEIPEKAINIMNDNKIVEKSNKTEQTFAPKPDVNQIITDALSYFRNNCQK